MKFNKFVLLLISLLLTGCNINNNESTTTSDDSSASFINNENEVKEIKSNANLNQLNGYEGLTPSIGDIDILLIPIHFEDINVEMDVSLIDKAFNSYKKDESIEYYSVKEYYEISSYGKCNLSFDIKDTYTPSQVSTYYTSKYNNITYTSAVEEIIVEALNDMDATTDFTKYDSDNDGYIDGIYLIYDRPVDYTYRYDLWWAWTYYFDNSSILFDNMKIKSYVFAGYDFLKEQKRNCSTHTYIHETAHLFGIDDYYDYNPNYGTNKGGLAMGDMMDGTIGDHNAFTKSLLGWNTGKLITPESQITLDLEAFCNDGNYFILANNFDENKGILQEYFIIEYYTIDKLNEFDKMFTINGLRVLHVLADTKKDGTFKYNNAYTNPKLISQITSSTGTTYLTSTTERSDDTLFIEGESLTSVKFADDTYLNYTFTVDKLSNESATITILKK